MCIRDRVIIFTLLFSQNIFAVHSSDSLYVWALSGLNMRATPDLKGKKIMTIPFGKKVKVEHFYGKELTIQVIKPYVNGKTNYDGFKMKGFWSKVSYQNKSGYVFSGYLSALPLVEVELKETKNGNQKLVSKEDIKQWAEQNFGILNTIERYDSLNEHRMKRHIYANGIVIIEESGKCHGQKIIIPNVTYNEIFLLVNLVWQIEQDFLLKDEESAWIQKQTDTEFYGPLDTMCNFVVNHALNVGVIAFDCCC